MSTPGADPNQGATVRTRVTTGSTTSTTSTKPTQATASTSTIAKTAVEIANARLHEVMMTSVPLRPYISNVKHKAIPSYLVFKDDGNLYLRQGNQDHKTPKVWGETLREEKVMASQILVDDTKECINILWPPKT
jgi:hypothetical protein